MSQDISPFNSELYENIIHIWNPLFRTNYYYYIVETNKQFKDQLCREYSHLTDSDFYRSADKTTSGGLLSFEVTQDGFTQQVYALWSNTDRDLIHECFHAVIFDLTHIGVDPRSDDGEVGAYLIGFLYDNIIKRKGEYEMAKKKAKVNKPKKKMEPVVSGKKKKK